MAIKKVEASLSFWQRTYLPEVLRGLRITARHFFRNIAIHILQLFGVAKNKRGA